MKAKLAALLLIFATLAPAVYAASGVGAHVGGLPVKLGPCASGFTRAAPNFCVRTDSVATANLTRDACTSVTLPIASASALLLHVTVSAVSANVALTNRTTQIQAWSNSACNATVLALFDLTILEINAVAGGLALGSHGGSMMVPVIGGAVWLKMIDDAGNAGAAGFQVRGYWEK